eukprot:13401343-Heterocapsa_arctica.AAC.1
MPRSDRPRASGSDGHAKLPLANINIPVVNNVKPPSGNDTLVAMITTTVNKLVDFRGKELEDAFKKYKGHERELYDLICDRVGADNVFNLFTDAPRAFEVPKTTVQFKRVEPTPRAVPRMPQQRSPAESEGSGSYESDYSTSESEPPKKQQKASKPAAVERRKEKKEDRAEDKEAHDRVAAKEKLAKVAMEAKDNKDAKKVKEDRARQKDKEKEKKNADSKARAEKADRDQQAALEEKRAASMRIAKGRRQDSTGEEVFEDLTILPDHDSIKKERGSRIPLSGRMLDRLSRTVIKLLRHHGHGLHDKYTWANGYTLVHDPLAVESLRNLGVDKCVLHVIVMARTSRGKGRFDVTLDSLYIRAKIGHTNQYIMHKEMHSPYGPGNVYNIFPTKRPPHFLAMECSIPCLQMIRSEKSIRVSHRQHDSGQKFLYFTTIQNERDEEENPRHFLKFLKENISFKKGTPILLLLNHRKVNESRCTKCPLLKTMDGMVLCDTDINMNCIEFTIRTDTPDFAYLDHHNDLYHICDEREDNMRSMRIRWPTAIEESAMLDRYKVECCQHYVRPKGCRQQHTVDCPYFHYSGGRLDYDDCDEKVDNDILRIKASLKERSWDQKDEYKKGWPEPEAVRLSLGPLAERRDAHPAQPPKCARLEAMDKAKEVNVKAEKKEKKKEKRENNNERKAQRKEEDTSRVDLSSSPSSSSPSDKSEEPVRSEVD